MIYYTELGMVKVSAELKGFLKRNPYMEIYPFFIDPQPKYKSYPYIKNN